MNQTEPSETVSQHEARTAFVLVTLYGFSRLSPPRFVPGNVLLHLCNSMMSADRRFEDAKEFVAFMAGLVDSGMALEKSGRTLTGGGLASLQFSLSKVIHVLLAIAGAKVGDI
jgi:hypothetical protein